MKKLLFISLVIITGMVIMTSCSPKNVNTPVTSTPTPPPPTKTAPGAPTNIVVNALDGSADVNFKAPVNTGNDSITGYKVLVYKSNSLVNLYLDALDIDSASTKTTHRILGLKNLRNYTVQVIAKNSTGSSPLSLPSDMFTPLSDVNKYFINHTFVYNRTDVKRFDLTYWFQPLLNLAYEMQFYNDGTYKEFTDSTHTKLFGNGLYSDSTSKVNGVTYMIFEGLSQTINTVQTMNDSLFVYDTDDVQKNGTIFRTTLVVKK